MSKVPVIVYAESTPNPSAMKFVASRILFDGQYPLEFLSPEQAKPSPLAQELFRFPFVKSIFLLGNYITVFKSDNVQWEEITLELREFLKEYLIAEKTVVNLQDLPSETPSACESPASGPIDHVAPATDVEKKIVEILEQYVTPAVGQDGGMIVFHSFKDGVVSLMMRGACSGCPSSTFTLKSGIESLLKRFIPEVKEVVSV